jgi:hypothetical protein
VSPSILEPARPELFNFRFAAHGNFKEKFERLAEGLAERPARLIVASDRSKSTGWIPLT